MHGMLCRDFPKGVACLLMAKLVLLMIPSHSFKIYRLPSDVKMYPVAFKIYKSV